VLGLAGIIAFLQYRTLEKTDKTLRAGQTAFVFLQNIQMSEEPIPPRGYEWYFIANVTNNGTTQTKNFVSRLACKKNPLSSEIGIRHSVLGPKQTDGIGACTWPADQLVPIWQNRGHIFMVGDATYDDVFGEHHIFRFCRDIAIRSDPRNTSGVMQQVQGVCRDQEDCADKECERNRSTLPSN
jgi:hypothetical protein